MFHFSNTKWEEFPIKLSRRSRMKTLTKENFQRARQWLGQKGRPLDWILFLFHFEHLPKESVVTVLQSFQNSDGGFGHALEPDLRTPQSSALATAIALRILVETGIAAENPLLRRTLSYLEKTLDRDKLIWPIAPQARQAFPHAPWWGGEDVVQDFGGCLANPRSQILASLLAFPGAFSHEILQKTLTSTMSALESLPEKMEMHDLVCFLHLLNAPQLPVPLREKIRPHLQRAVNLVVTRDPALWAGYAVKPLLLCPSPQSFFAEDLKDAIEANLDFEVDRQEENGVWLPNWSWADFNPTAWPEAQREWTSHLTLEMLLTLKRYGRLEGL